MKNRILFVYLALVTFQFISQAYAQSIITINQTQPCFLNFTATYHIFENCNAGDDYISWIMSGWQYSTGGFFTMILVSVIITAVYMKYKEVVYVIFIGLVFLPISFAFFPEVFLSWAIVMAFIGIGILMWYAIVRQTER